MPKDVASSLGSIVPVARVSDDPRSIRGFVESGLEKFHVQARPGGATDRRILQMLC